MDPSVFKRVMGVPMSEARDIDEGDTIHSRSDRSSQLSSFGSLEDFVVEDGEDHMDVDSREEGEE